MYFLFDLNEVLINNKIKGEIMSILIKDIAQYNTLKDYYWLAQEAKKQSIICIIDYKFNTEDKEYIFRDVAQTVYFEKNGNGSWQISARGTGFLNAFSEEEFIKLCEILNVEYIKP